MGLEAVRAMFSPPFSCSFLWFLPLFYLPLLFSSSLVVLPFFSLWPRMESLSRPTLCS